VPDGEIVVVRGGVVRDVATLKEVIEDAIDVEVGPVLSVFAAPMEPGESLDDTVGRICRAARLPHSMIQVSTDRRLAEAGFTLEPDQSEGQAEMHCHVPFDDPVAESQVGQFISCLDEPILNPTGGNKRTT
jgi:hypothetical protein